MSHPFVSSKDIPDEIAEKVALVAHERGCGAFDGRKRVRGPKFEGDHRRADLVRASIHISDVCNALGLPADLGVDTGVRTGVQ